MQLTITKELNCVGAGTVVLPGGTYNSVLMISGLIVETYLKNGALDNVVTHNVHYYYSDQVSHPLVYSRNSQETGPFDYIPYTVVLSSIAVNIKETSFDNGIGFQLTPNPAIDRARITTLLNETAEIALINSTGKIILTQTLNDGLAELDLQALPGGLYTITVLQGGTIHNKKLILVR